MNYLTANFVPTLSDDALVEELAHHATLLRDARLDSDGRGVVTREDVKELFATVEAIKAELLVRLAA